MCDYSLHAVKTRKAAIGDKLVTTNFWSTSTRGFADVADEAHDGLTAVCLIPGTEVAFDEPIVSHQSFLSIFPPAKVTHPHKTAVFAKVDMNNQCAHHDALEFPDGSTVLLTCLSPGQRATVLQLGAEPKVAPAKPEQAPIADVVVTDELHVARPWVEEIVG